MTRLLHSAVLITYIFIFITATSFSQDKATLEAPSEVNAGSEFSVSWTGPDSRGDMVTIVEADTEEGKYGNYTYTKRSKKDRDGNPYVKITAPDEHGSYEIRYIDGNSKETLARRSINVVETSAELEAPSVAEAGSGLRVYWTGPDNRGDMITVVESGTEEGKYDKYQYTKRSKKDRDGKTYVVVRLSEIAGYYEIRYITGQSRKTLARKSLEIKPVDATVEAPSEVEAGADFRVYWTGPDNRGDFITIVVTDTEEGKYGKYQYTKRSKKDPDGKEYVSLTAPDAAGSYEVRYLTGQEYFTLARIPVTVTSTDASLTAPDKAKAGSHIDVYWTGPDNRGDFVTVVEVDTEEGKYGNYTYTKRSKNDAKGNSYVSVRVPEKAGSYEIRYLTGQTNSTLARIPLTVTSVDAEVEVPSEVVAGSEFKVFWDGPDNKGDFITIVEEGTEEGEYGKYQYTKRSKEDAEGKVYVNLTAPDEEGSYEVRYLTSDRHRTIARSGILVSPADADLDAPGEVVAGERFSVNWTGPDNRGDYIAIVEADAETGKYLKYGYTKRGNPVKIEAPESVGPHELRYYTGQSERILATRPIEVLESREPGIIRVVSDPEAGIPETAVTGAIELILDASGSMLQKLEGRTRMSIARSAVTGLIQNSLEEGVPFAMRVFGHKEADSCRTDLEIPLAPLDKNKVISRVNDINAKNLAKTSIAKSLSLVADDLSGVESKAIIILVTDGEETCEGDPKQAIESLKESGYDVRVNIVGFAIDEVMLKETFREWARVGNGSYFDAKNAEELGRSISEAIETPFEVIGNEGDVAATGVLNGEPVEVPPGTYSIRILSGKSEQVSGVEIEPGKYREVTLE